MTLQQGMPMTTGLRTALWDAVDKLRGSMDAPEYKYFVLRLIFLKYVSAAFEERRDRIAVELAAEGIPQSRVAGLLEDPDEYVGAGVFWVPADARWSTIAAHAKSENIGVLVDTAIRVLEDANPTLRNVLPKASPRMTVDTRRLGALVDLISRVGADDRPAADGLREVYKYLLRRFAKAEGKRGGEFYSPAIVTQLLVEVLAPTEQDRVYDPCCGSGGMLVEAERFVERQGGLRGGISVFGQEANESAWRLAKMNLALHGMSADLGERWADTFRSDVHLGLRADVVMANPPFNVSDWGGDGLASDRRWRYGKPSARNANFAWLQHIAAHLADQGSAGVVLANGSLSSTQSGDGEIRRAMIMDDLVSCVVALPGQLFHSTAIPTCIWFLARDKGAQDPGPLADRSEQVLFIDARSMGVMVDRTNRELTSDEISVIVGTFHRWRRSGGEDYVDEPGFCYSADIGEIAAQDFVLTPGRYVGTAAPVGDEPTAESVGRLTAELFSLLDESARLDDALRRQLGRVDV